MIGLEQRKERWALPTFPYLIFSLFNLRHFSRMPFGQAVMAGAPQSMNGMTRSALRKMPGTIWRGNGLGPVDIRMHEGIPQESES